MTSRFIDQVQRVHSIKIAFPALGALDAYRVLGKEHFGHGYAEGGGQFIAFGRGADWEFSGGYGPAGEGDGARGMGCYKSMWDGRGYGNCFCGIWDI
jgi:hypothetical protein